MKRALPILFLFCFSFVVKSQAPSCPVGPIYCIIGNTVVEQPVFPVGSPSVTLFTNLPPGANGLAIGPAFSFPAPNPTFWTVSGGTYWYYSGTAWVNTGHTTGNVFAINPGGGGSVIYNLVGGTGAVYVYNGTGNGTLLTTVAGFNGGGPFDMVADVNNNFYLLNTNSTPQTLSVYDATGAFLCSYTLGNTPVAGGGAGFAIVNNVAYYGSTINNTTSASYAGTIIPNNTVITFTSEPLTVGGDWASCPISAPAATLLAPQGTVLTCTAPTLPLIGQVIPGGIGMFPGPPSSTLTSCNYTWTGPGIVSGQGTGSITVNQAGVYAFTVCASGCPSQKVTHSITVTGVSYITATVTAPACITTTQVVSVLPNTATNSAVWSGPNIIGPANNFTATIGSGGIYTVVVSDTMGCVGTATVNVIQSPSISISLSSPSICAQNLNLSPTSLSITASGGLSYTLITSPGFSTTAPGPWVYNSPGTAGTVSVTVIGFGGLCTGSNTIAFPVLPNPTVSVTPPFSNVCIGDSIVLTASGTQSYSWLPAPGLSASSGATVSVNPTAATVYSVYGLNQLCNSAVQTATVNVWQLPAVFVSPTASTICVGDSVQLTASGNATSYAWLPANGLPAQTAVSVSAKPTATENFTVTGYLNTCTNSAISAVTVLKVPVLNVGASEYTVCSGVNIQMYVDGANTFNWEPSSGITTPTGATVTTVPNSNTTYTVTGSNGVCASSNTLYIQAVPNPSLSTDLPLKQICMGASVSMSVSGAQSFTWNPFATLSNSVGPSVIASPTVSTTYSIIGSNTSGSVTCSRLVNYSVEVLPLPDLKVSPGVSVCPGANTILTALGGTSYFWRPFTGLDTVLGPQVIANPTVTTVYTVEAINEVFCRNTATVAIWVKQRPWVFAGRDTVYSMEEFMSISAQGNGTLTWVGGEGILCPDCPQTKIEPQKDNCYTVEVVNKDGCRAQDQVCIQLTDNYGIYIPNSFTPNRDGLNDVFMVYGTGISSLSMDIWDRWGMHIFSAKDYPNNWWDGTFKGTLCKPDTYIYVISYRNVHGKNFSKTGHINIVR